MYSISKWQKINFKTSQFNNFAFCRKSMTYDGHNVAKVFFATRPTNPIWVRVQRIPSFFLSYCKQKFYHHFCKAWGFMLQNQGNMPWCIGIFKLNTHFKLTFCVMRSVKWRQKYPNISSWYSSLPQTSPSPSVSLWYISNILV